MTESIRNTIAALASFAALALMPGFTVAQISVPDPELGFPLPESGRWGPRDGSRTGLYLEVQDRIGAGIWVGYDADGQPLWLSFHGTLEPWISSFGSFRIGWELVGRLTRFEGGGCIVIGEDCDGSVVGTTDNEALQQWLRLRFDQRNTAQLEVLPAAPEIGTPPPGAGSGPFPLDEPVFGPIELVPLYFGVDSVNMNPEQPLERVPDLEGTWLAVNSRVILNQGDLSLGPVERERPRILELGPRELIEYALTIPVDGDLLARLSHPILTDSSGPVDSNAEVWCETRYLMPEFASFGFFVSICGIDGIEDAGLENFFGSISATTPAALSDARMDFIYTPFDIVIGDPTGTGAPYHRLTLFRLDHD